MELRHLRYALAVAEELHFGRAARRLHMTQPPLSQQIRALEEELGVELFARTRRRVELTDAGRVFVAEARAILERVADAGRALQGVAAGTAGRLRLAYNETSLDAVLAKAVRRFRRERDGVELILQELSSDDQLEAIRAREVDLAFPRIFCSPLHGLEHAVVAREPYVAALPKRHPLARKRRLRLSALAGEPLVMFPRALNEGLYNELLNRLDLAGGQPRVVQEASGKSAALALVRAGLGIALVPRSVAGHGEVAIRPLEPGLPDVVLAMVWLSSNRSAALARFREICLERTPAAADAALS